MMSVETAPVENAPPRGTSRQRVPMSRIMAQFGGGSSYAAAAQFDRNVQMWNPSLRSADSEILRDAGKLRARARDLYRNDPYARQIVRQAVLAVVGKKLRFKTRVDHEFLGIDQEEADRWGRTFDRLWEQYAHGPGAYVDAGRRWNFSQLMRLALRARFVDGETVAAFEWAPGRRFQTCIQLVDVDRLSNPHGMVDSASLRGGVELDAYSAPVGYYIRNGHPSDAGIDAVQRAMAWSFVPRETAWGRPVIAHSFLPDRVGQTRGISEFATVIRTMRMEGEFAEADLASAIMQASYAMVIKSSADYGKAMEAIGVDVEVDENGEVVTNPLSDLMMSQLAAAAAYHNEAKLSFGANRIPHLVPGEELQMVTPGNKATSAPEFSKAAIKRYAAGLGGDPIAVSQDYSDVNYSSARMSVASNWRGHEVTRGDIVYEIAMPLVQAFLEEMIFAGAMKMPKGVREADFYDALPALAKGVFLASGPPMLDPVKERQGQQMGWAMGLDTMEEMAAQEGDDYEEKIKQKGREIALMRAHGVPLPGEPVLPPGMNQPALPADDADDETDDG